MRFKQRDVNIITDLSKFNKQAFPNLVVALGNFDGVHAGHQKILSMIRTRAKKIGGTSAVFTFKEHPEQVLRRNPKDPLLLTAPVHRLHLLKWSGVDLCFLLAFTRTFAETEPEDFVRKVLIEKLGAREICLGYNARFGRNRKGDAGLMTKLARRWGFKFLRAPCVKVGGAAVSSSLIRSLVRAGKLKKASRLLGRPYAFFGSVVKGRGRGAQLGFPTANLDPCGEVLPPEGVYATTIRILECSLKTKKTSGTVFQERIKSERFKALLNYGTRPTFGEDTRPVPEVHLLDYRDSLKGKTAEVTILRRFRGEKTFRDVEELKKQIQVDIRRSRRYFKAVIRNDREIKISK